MSVGWIQTAAWLAALRLAAREHESERLMNRFLKQYPGARTRALHRAEWRKQQAERDGWLAGMGWL